MATTQSSVQCNCCLQRPSMHDLRTPHTRLTRLGITEPYSTILEECFAIQLTSDSQCGICEECVVRLLDAFHFKLQVQHCQETLRLQAEHGHVVPALESALRDCWVRLERCDARAGTLAETTDAPAMFQETLPRQLPVLRQETLPRRRTRPRQVINSDTYRHTTVRCVGSIRSEPAQQETVPPQKKCVVTNANLCDTCGQTFQQEYSLTKHVKMHMVQLNKLRVLKRMFNKSTIKKGQRRTRRKPYGCKICKRKLATLASFKLHQLTHTGRMPFSCDICKRQFAEKDLLKSHKVLHKGKPNSDEMFRKEFRQLSDIKPNKIQETDPYCCEICKDPFTEWSSLNRHMLIHKEEPYWCEICKKRFSTSDLLSKHEWNHTIDKMIISLRPKVSRK